MLVDEGIECQSISPTGGEISDIYIGVASCLHLTPEQQRILRRFHFTALNLFNGNVLNLTIKTFKNKHVNCFDGLHMIMSNFHKLLNNANFIKHCSAITINATWMQLPRQLTGIWIKIFQLPFNTWKNHKP